jgi:hypothetical protein
MTITAANGEFVCADCSKDHRLLPFCGSIVSYCGLAVGALAGPIAGILQHHPDISVVVLSQSNWASVRKSYMSAGALAYFEDKGIEFQQARDFIADLASARSATEAQSETGSVAVSSVLPDSLCGPPSNSGRARRIDE